MSHPSRIPTVSLLLALTYFATGRLGLMLPAFGSIISLLWLPSGIALAALLRWGRGCWSGVALGSAAVNVAIGIPLPAALAISVGNTLGPVLSVWLLRRIGFHSALDRKRDILLLAGAAMLGMLVSSSLGVLSLSLSGLLSGGRIAAWVIWWAGDTMGVIAAAPLVMAFNRTELRPILQRPVEFLLWLCVTVLTIFWVFIVNDGVGNHGRGLSSVPLPLVAWAAFRYGPVGTSLAIILISFGATYVTAIGQGPFHRSQPIEGCFILWSYMATCAALGWLITALHAARVRATGIQRIFETALSDVSLGVVICGLDGRITFANEGFTRLTGYSHAEILGRTCAHLQGPETDQGTVDRMRAAIARTGYFEGEILNHRKDGTKFWNGLLISPVRDDLGGTTGFLGIHSDITQRRAIEDSLRGSEARYRQLFEANPHPMWAYDLESLRFLAVNNAAIAHYGYSRDEFLAMTIKDIRPPEDIPALLANVEAVTQGFDSAGIWHHRKRDGTIIDVEISSHVIEFAGRHAEIVLAHDVTERRRAEARLLKAEDAERRRIAQELHDSTAQDLVAATMNLGVLQESLGPDDLKSARIIADSVALIENSVNSLRTLSYILHPPRLDETGLAGALAEYVNGLTARTEMRIRAEIAPDFGRLQEDMEVVLFRVVQEGIANVLRHSMSDTATIRLARKDSIAVLEVEDYGRGMAGAGAPGVGIAGMRERLQRLGGRLEIESDSSGTIVRAVLPLRENHK